MIENCLYRRTHPRCLGGVVFLVVYYNKWTREVFMGNGLIFFHNFYFAGITVLMLIVFAVVTVKM